MRASILRNAVLLALCAFSTYASALPIRITTWNLQWFPNSSPHEKSAPVQTKQINQAAEVIRALSPDILLLQEVKDYETCQRLADAIEPGSYKIAICSAFKQRRGIGRQQVAILAKENAQAAWAESWVSVEKIDPPRGFAFAWFKINGTDIGVYSVHLKSNLILVKQKDAELALDIQKREIAATQLVNHVRGVVAKTMTMVTSVVIGGDFNTTQDQQEFAAEKTQSTLVDAGFHSAFESVPQVLRVTHPGEGKYPNATFDYLFGKNVTFGKPAITESEVSDHYPVTCDFEAPGTTTSPVDASAASKQGADVRVWAHFPTRTYFKPGMLLYGKTRDGTYMKESEAIANGFRPAGAK